jgi:phage-related protein
MGVRLRGPAPIIRPEERVNHITIPGRSGDLTQLEGTDIYNSYIQTVTIMAHGANRMGKAIYDWMRGESYVTFSGEPDKRQKARIIGAITLDRHSYNLDWWEGEVQFYCQPLKELLQNEPVEITTSGTAVINRGDVASRPVIRATLSGSNASITVGGKTFSVTGVTDEVIEINSVVEEVLNYNGTSILTDKSSGDFPILSAGSNVITGSGWTKLVIDRGERYL